MLSMRQIAINDFKTFDFVLVRTSSITELIYRYALVEQLLRSPSPAMEELRRALIKLYINIMVYFVGARAYFLQHTAS